MPSKKLRFRKTLLSAAIAMALAPVVSQAKLKLGEIEGLPHQAGTPTLMRSGKDSSGNVTITWIENGSLKLETIPRSGTPPTTATVLASDVVELTTQDLLVKADGSYLAAWNAATQLSGLLSDDLVTELELGIGDGESLALLPRKTGGFALVSGQSASFFDDTGVEDGSPLDLEPYTAIILDDDGDFVLLSHDTYQATLSLKDGADLPKNIQPSQTVNAYGFDEGSNTNKSVAFSIAEPKMRRNDKGEILLTWQEQVDKTQRKPIRTCHTYYGERTCSVEGYSYSGSTTKTLLAQRFNSNLSVKDTRPVAVASVKGKLVGDTDFDSFIGDVAIDMDEDGDFTVAYASGKHVIETSSYAGSTYSAVVGSNSDLFARQFTTNAKGKLVAGKAMKLSSTAKTAHPQQKGKVKYSTNSEPDIIVTDDAKNEFLVTWRNEFEDHYKDADNTVQVCAKYKKDEYGDKYCLSYKDVPGDALDTNTLFKAKRYINQ